MRIAVGCDHGGFALKTRVVDLLKARGHEVIDMGCYTPDPAEYPEHALQVTSQVTEGKADSGILICGTGIGMSLVANKVRGIRAALATDPYMARMARAHNDANVLCLGGRVIGPGLVEDILDAWLKTGFEGGRHAERVKAISRVEQQQGLGGDR